jgi:hypothetical protein
MTNEIITCSLYNNGYVHNEGKISYSLSCDDGFFYLRVSLDIGWISSCWLGLWMDD